MKNYEDSSCCEGNGEEFLRQAEDEIQHDMAIVVKNELKDLMIQIEEARRNVTLKEHDLGVAVARIDPDLFGFATSICKKRRDKNG